MDELKKQGLGVAAISYDRQEVLARFATERGVQFPLLSDSDSAVIKRFGLLNTVVDEALGPLKDDPSVKADVARHVSVAGVIPRMAGMAFPGTIIVDRRGRVTSRFFEASYTERSTAARVSLQLGGGAAPVSATQIDTAHVSIMTYPSDAEVSAGHRFSLALDVTPRRGMHVYAPGASSYRVIALTIEPQPFVRAGALSHPMSEIYWFKPLDERVPVYRRPFRLVQDLVLEGSREAQAALKGHQALVIRGTLDYQACDDKVCFNPVSLPLSWSVALRPLVGR